MSAALDAVIARILEHEGGVKDVGDGKGVTRFGQTPDWLDDHGFVPPSTAADAATNYETWFRQTGLAALIERDPIAGYLVADFAVHGGLVTALKALQRALGVRDDGVLGPVTRARFTEVAGRPQLARRLLAERMRHTGVLLASLKVDRRQWAHGWLNRLADLVETLP